MYNSDNPQRQRVLPQVLAATSLPEIESAACALRPWVKDHPDDLGINAAFEQLSLMKDIAEDQEAQRLLDGVAPFKPFLS
jgi:hypothetical protein